ncbi:polymorphic toxin-type HINT domain-containing protein [Crossiella sp. CA198]|uniref:polymorphic toxin-type HINT domain-containing protein n=1 Tax=Crossiella sp. CA198 TaxID=3455607 RepID=UPI003F8D1E98
MDKVRPAKALLAKVDSIADDLKANGGSCPRQSFVPGTRVLLADGSSKPIEEIRIGDRVRAADPEKGESGARAVVGTVTSESVKRLVTVTVDTDGDRGEATGSVVATTNHPFWVDNQGRWVKAGELALGDQLVDAAGRRVEAVATSSWVATQRVHNFTVDGIHTYYVQAGGVPVLAHNCGDVYRSDPRDPSEIFEEGFKPLGDNMNLAEHVAGVSGRFAPASGYVATSTSKAHAMGRNGHTYVVDRRGAAGGIDVNKAIPGNVHKNEMEIAVPRAIDSCHIRGCWHGTTGEWMPNPNYGG